MPRYSIFQKLFAFVAIIVVLLLSGGAFAQSNRDAAFERVKEVHHRHTEKLMARKGVVGAAVGLGDDGNPALLVLLEHGKVAGIPGQLDGVRVKKVITGRIYALPRPKKLPKRPAGLTATVISSTEIALDWAENRDKNLDHFEVYRSETSGGNYSFHATALTSEFLDAGCDPDTAYYYIVKAANTDSQLSRASAEASATTSGGSGTPNDPPKTPVGLTATAMSSTEISLDWADNLDEDLNHYDVYRSETPGGNYGAYAATLASKFLDQGCSPDTTYYYTIRAVDTESLPSEASLEVFATTLEAETVPLDPPSQPQGLVSSDATNRKVSLDWNDNAPLEHVTSYEVYRAIGSSDPTDSDWMATTSASEYSDTTVSAATTYSYAIKAVNIEGPSAMSGSINVTTLEDTTEASIGPRPAPIGISTGHPDVTAGTIGC
ncbi:MAG: hypothetical protein GY809_25105, partial [Planctomycetes bacterium]|nr:hypothetical protein [Planctomycetota bacterium]